MTEPERDVLEQIANDIRDLRDKARFWHDPMTNGKSRAESLDEMITAWNSSKAQRQMLTVFGTSIWRIIILVSAIGAAFVVVRDLVAAFFPK